MIKALLFDLDDTLMNKSDASHIAFQEFHRTYFPGSKFEALSKLWETISQKYFEKYANGEITFQQQRRGRIREIFKTNDLNDFEADSRFETYLSVYENNYKIFEDVLPFLKWASQFTLGVISNGETNQQKFKMNKTGIYHYFKAVLISEEVGIRKPKSEIFKLAATQLNVVPEECLFIGDNIEADYYGSQNAGMYPVLINRKGKITQNGIRQIKSLSEINGILESINGPGKIE